MPDLRHLDAVLFDLDGVLTSTAALHAACWKAVFDEFLPTTPAPATSRAVRRRARLPRPRRRPPRARRRADFLAARGIRPPRRSRWGRSPTASRRSSSARSARDGVEAFPGSVRWVRAPARAPGRDRRRVLERQLPRECCARPASPACSTSTVDGRDVASSACAASRRPTASSRRPAAWGVPPAARVVVEDALSGVAAGRAGGFGLVIGVARGAAPGRPPARPGPTSSSTTSRSLP